MVTGILPMAGTGSRLGLPFPKALAPTIDVDGTIRPLYWHAYARLAAVASEVRFVLPPDPDPCLAGLPGITMTKHERGELPSSLALAAASLAADEVVAVALPDSIWFPAHALKAAAHELTRTGADVVLAVFNGNSHLLDEVTCDGPLVTAITRHDDPPAPERKVGGWGAFVARAAVLHALTDSAPLGPQLVTGRTGWIAVGAEYVDLGTPERYRAFHDLRVWR